MPCMQETLPNHSAQGEEAGVGKDYRWVTKVTVIDKNHMILEMELISSTSSPLRKLENYYDHLL